MHFKKILRKIANISIFLVIITVVGFFIANYFFDIKFVYPYIVQSGSMEPAIRTGSLVFSLPSNNYNPGDVITFSANGLTEKLITHRVEFKLYPDGINNEPAFLTSGDANSNFDRWEITQENIVGKVIFTVPYLGYVADFAKQPYGFILLVIIPATIVIYEEFKILIRESILFLKKVTEDINIRRFIPKRKVPPEGKITREQIEVVEKTINLAPKRQSIGIHKASILLPVIGSILVITSISAAFFFDNETSTDNILAAAESFNNENTPTPLPTPTEVQPGNVIINEINWVGSNGSGLDEWVELLNTTSSVIDISSWVVENLGTGGGPNKDVVIPPSSSIPANGFYLISNHNRVDSKIDVDPNLVTSNVSLNNGGEQLILKTNLGTTIDTGNGTGAWFEGDNSTPKKTMERKTPPGDGTQAANWQTASTHTNMDDSGPTDEFGTPEALNGI